MLIFVNKNASDHIINKVKDFYVDYTSDVIFKDWLHGLVRYCGSGDPSTGSGLNIYTYLAIDNMFDSFINCDGDFLIVPQTGKLDIQTELGKLLVNPGEIVIIPRGIAFKVDITDKDEDSFAFARGYVLEVFDGHFELPELGPIGANGLAYPRHFQIPVAYFDELDHAELNDKKIFSTVTKFQNSFFISYKPYSPFNVVAWHGNYYPFKYDLNKFCALNSVTYDHPDPSIFTVLTCKNSSGIVCADFAVFKPRWSVAENTFRPPYFHRNCMSEFMGLINGMYDAKKGGFVPGGASLHHCMIPHGPDFQSYKKGVEAEEAPNKINCGLAFMFETSYMLKIDKNTEVLDMQLR